MNEPCKRIKSHKILLFAKSLELKICSFVTTFETKFFTPRVSTYSPDNPKQKNKIKICSCSTYFYNIQLVLVIKFYNELTKLATVSTKPQN